MNSTNLTQPESAQEKSAAVIKVFGVGGGGCNALEQMIAANINGVTFKCLNTDAQALEKYRQEDTIVLGTELTKGLGAGADPNVGRMAAEESSEEIAAAIGDADMLFLTSGMGGGTGTGAVSVVSRIARELGVLTVAVVTEPFAFEGIRRKTLADEGLAELRDNADSMIVVPNENLMTFLGPDVSLIQAFAAANDVVTNAVQSIAELITTSGLINVDFADVKTVMTEMGHAIMSTGTGMGEHRARDAANSAIESPLLNNIDLKEARGILANITSSSDLSMGEFQIVGDVIRQIAADNANVVVGTVFDEDMQHEIKVTVVATGLKPPSDKPAKKRPVRATTPEPVVTAPVITQQATETGAAAEEYDAQPEDVAAAPETPDTADTECIVCGGIGDAHQAKCPLAAPIEQEMPPVPQPTTRPEIAQTTVHPTTAQPTEKKAKNLKMIAAAGVLAIGAAATAFFVMQQGSTDDNSLADSAPVITNPMKQTDLSSEGLTGAAMKAADPLAHPLPHMIPEMPFDSELTELDDE